MSEVKFARWMKDLERIAADWDAKHGNLPYRLPLSDERMSTGTACWRGMYDDGMTPIEAFEEDQAAWSE